MLKYEKKSQKITKNVKIWQKNQKKVCTGNSTDSTYMISQKNAYTLIFYQHLKNQKKNSLEVNLTIMLNMTACI